MIYPGEIEVKENDERTFSEIGIRNNFICKWKVQKKVKKWWFNNKYWFIKKTYSINKYNYILKI